METHNTQTLLLSLQQQTELLLEKAVREWQMITPAIFKKQPSPNAWSAMQCIGHLNMYGDYYLPAIENAITVAKNKGNINSEVFTPGLLGNYFTNLMKTTAGKPSKKMKAPKGYTISNEGLSDEVIATFIDQQEKLLQLLEDAKDVNLNNIRIPISIAKFIKLKLGDVFMFLIAHNVRHVQQADRAIDAAGNVNKLAGNFKVAV